METFGLAIVSKFKNTDNPPDHPEEQIIERDTGHGFKHIKHIVETGIGILYIYYIYILYFLFDRYFPRRFFYDIYHAPIGITGFLEKDSSQPIFRVDSLPVH